MRKIRVGPEPHLPNWIRDDDTGEVIPCCIFVLWAEGTHPRPGPAVLHRLDPDAGAAIEEPVEVASIRYATPFDTLPRNP